MTEFREVSEAEASAPRVSAPTRAVAFNERRELLWPGEVVAMRAYVVTWHVWVAVVSFLWRSQLLLAKLWTAKESGTASSSRPPS